MSNVSRGLLLGLLLVAAPVVRAADRPASPSRHLVVVSIDGLPPAAYSRPDELGLAVPTLRRLAAAGARASGVEGVLPSVTYPSHTTLLTGLPPALHGIVANTVLDPTGRSNDAWHWYAREIRATTLVDAVRAAGGTVGSVFWPVSVGMEADALVPEFWRTGSTDPVDLDLLRALSTPGLFDLAERERGRPFDAFPGDGDRTDLALTILRHEKPTLLLLHLAEVDKLEHRDGPFSPAAKTAIEGADRELGRIVDAIAASGLSASTLLAVVSDHGFLGATKLFRPNVLLVEHDLATLDDKGKVTAWKAWFHSHGGSASLHLADPADGATLALVRRLLEAKRSEPGSGIAAILGRDEIERLGGDPDAELFVDAADGWSISRTPTGGWSGEPTDRGFHGYDPRRPELHAALVLAGPPGLPASDSDLGVVAMTRIGPTFARWLGVSLDPRAAAPLPIFDGSALSDSASGR